MKRNIIVAIGVVILATATMFAAYYSGIIKMKSVHAEKTASVCSADDGHGHEKKNDHASEGAPMVNLTKEQAKLIKLQIREASAGDIENILRLNGEIQLNMDETAKIMPRMPGFVTEIQVKEGDVVKAGALMARLTSHKLGEYNSDYNSALELEKLTLSEFKMAEKLKDGHAVSEKEFLRYKREHADAVIARRRAEALLKSLRIDPAHNNHSHEADTGEVICTEYEIRAPFDGTVIEKNITVGENFPEDNAKVLFVISNMKDLWLNLRANSTELKLLKPGMAVTAIPADSNREYQGKIIYIAPLIDEATRTCQVRAILKNPDGALRPGEFATGIIRTDSNGAVIVVQRNAVQLIAGETVIFVPKGDGFVARVVSIGKTANGYVQILSGLNAKERYVSLGAFELKSILLTSGMDPHAGHGH